MIINGRFATGNASDSKKSIQYYLIISFFATDDARQERQLPDDLSPSVCDDRESCENGLEVVPRGAGAQNESAPRRRERNVS